MTENSKIILENKLVEFFKILPRPDMSFSYIPLLIDHLRIEHKQDPELTEIYGMAAHYLAWDGEDSITVMGLTQNHAWIQSQAAALVVIEAYLETPLPTIN
ncbi:TPA: hypothetical protein I7730_00795 [Vibrio vulnificus]|uniref:Uncharacterized protein n=1 Tax=Vibrio vulnificus TaxID=672 RepID=A0A8H9K728_VIBVL|nr:hypothetical protein [Vibrio vulnificus]HAS8538337.1 hypothetical protein [Vibrio vulnificus]